MAEEIIETPSVPDVLARGDATGSTQVRVADKWVWQGKEAPQWAVDTAAVRAQRIVVTDAKTGLRDAGIAWDDVLDDLHDRTAQGLGMARSKYRRNPSVLALLKPLDASGDDRQDKMDEAREWLSTWSRLPDATWNPTAENTKTAFGALYNQSLAGQTTYQDAVTAERDERQQFYLMVGNLWEDCVEWYIDACLVFPQGTPEGELVRAVYKAKAAPEGDDATGGAGEGDDGLPPK
jgi:hypothetical protein